ncbi:hypothetical protein QQ045_007785 [Rhodiola kirilowii]
MPVTVCESKSLSEIVDLQTEIMESLQQSVKELTISVSKIEKQRAFHLPLPLVIPIFNGDQDVDVTTWLFLLDRFFSIHDTPHDQRLNISALYMTGPALQWLQWMHKHNAGRLSSWDLFVRDLEIRFEPSPYHNPEVSLYKLRQLGSVADYLSEFEALSARVKGRLTLQNLFNCFIAGLRDDISQELVFLRPKSLTDAIRMAKLVEQKLN